MGSETGMVLVCIQYSVNDFIILPTEIYLK